MMKKLILPLLIAALAMPVAVMACPGKGDGKRGGHCQKMDTNGDGKVTSDEMKSRWKKRHKNCPLSDKK